MKKVIQFVCAGIVGLTALAAQPQTARAHFCEVAAVVEGGAYNVVWINCKQPVVINGNSVYTVGIPNANPDIASRFMSTATAALLSGKRFWFETFAAGTAQPVWCPVSNCRVPFNYGILD